MRGSHRLALSIGTLLVVAAPSHGQITIDGKLPGTSFEVLAGPDFEIPASKGHQVGRNLFHSFEDFSIGAGGSATFTPEGSTGPVDNVLSRVTGANPSLIRGTLASAIPDADIFLINPNGFFFEEGATLDVPASFYAGAADFVELNDGSRFFGDHELSSVLSVAPVSDFGFLELPGAPIDVVGASLQVPSGANLALVGGFLLIGSEALLAAPRGHVRLRTPSGETRIITSAGVHIGEGSPTAPLNAVQILGGSVDIEGRISIDASDSIRIRNSAIGSFSALPEEIGNLAIRLEADYVELDGAEIFLGGSNSSVSIAARDVSMNRSLIEMENRRLLAGSEFPGSSFSITTRNLSMDRSLIVIDSVGSSGRILINASDSIRMQSSLIGSSERDDGGFTALAGAEINLRARSLLLMRDSDIRVDGSTDTTLAIDPVFIVLDASRVSQGSQFGGLLSISGDFLVLSPDSAIEANGTIVGFGELNQIPTGELARQIAREDPVEVQTSRCAIRDRAVGTLMQRGQGGTPNSPQRMLVAYSTMGATP